MTLEVASEAELRSSVQDNPPPGLPFTLADDLKNFRGSHLVQIDVKPDSFFALRNRGGSAETDVSCRRRFKWKGKRKNKNASFPPLLQEPTLHATNAKRPSVLYDQNHQDNLINNSRTGSKAPASGEPDHWHVLLIHSVGRADGGTLAPVRKGSSHSEAHQRACATAAPERRRARRGATGESREPLHRRSQPLDRSILVGLGCRGL